MEWHGISDGIGGVRNAHNWPLARNNTMAAAEFNDVTNSLVFPKVFQVDLVSTTSAKWILVTESLQEYLIGCGV